MGKSAKSTLEKRQGESKHTGIELQGPVKILQRNEQIRPEMTRQVPREKGPDKIPLNGGNRRSNYRNEYQTKGESVNSYWEQRNSYGKRK